jgi:hypothetical protein
MHVRERVSGAACAQDAASLINRNAACFSGIQPETERFAAELRLVRSERCGNGLVAVRVDLRSSFRNRSLLVALCGILVAAQRLAWQSLPNSTVHYPP